MLRSIAVEHFTSVTSPSKFVQGRNPKIVVRLGVQLAILSTLHRSQQVSRQMDRMSNRITRQSMRPDKGRRTFQPVSTIDLSKPNMGDDLNESVRVCSLYQAHQSDIRQNCGRENLLVASSEDQYMQLLTSPE